MSAPKLTIQDIRLFLMDRKELNPLLKGVRWDDQDIDQAAQRVVDYFNETPPFYTNYSSSNFPFRYTLLIGVAGHLLRSASINEASNQLNYSADGVTLQDKDKAEIFLRIGNMYWDEFKDKVSTVKVTQNLVGAYGGSPSELQYMAR